MMTISTAYQLWCFYETSDVWKMEGFFRTYDEAKKRQQELRDDIETPCMPDWLIQKVEVSW